MLDTTEVALNYFKAMHIADEDINILLMGETGVGKSTFINAFANYMKYDKFDVAEKGEVLCLIPAAFDVTDENFEVKTIRIGRNVNESAEVGQSATQSTMSYVFKLGGGDKTRVRLIDTPGVGDTRGLTQDNFNFENILNYVGKLDWLHAVCFLLKPNNARLTVFFKYCIKQLLSVLEKSASCNVVFLFTNTRNTFYRPGDTVPALMKILKEINVASGVEIQFNNENVFCLDNEAFRFMVSCKNNITFSKEDRQSFSVSWDQSVSECWRLIRYVTGKSKDSKLSPHLVSKTIAMNQARNVIVQLSKPLADIADLISNNISLLQRHKGRLEKEQDSIDDLNDRLYVSQVDLEIVRLKHPITVCTSSKCCEVYVVGGLKKTHYKQVCHDHCYLEGVPQDLIGSPTLVNCYAFDHPSKLCCECKCDFSSHMHLYYETRIGEKKSQDLHVLMEIANKQSAFEISKIALRRLEVVQKEYEAEREVIMKCMARFAAFLKRNAIVTYNDAYQDYVTFLIEREKSLGPEADIETVSHYHELLKRYEVEKLVLDEAFEVDDGGTSIRGTQITTQEIFDAIKGLFALKHTGQKIRDLHHQESKLRRKEEAEGNKEYVLEDFAPCRSDEGPKSTLGEAQGRDDSKFAQLMKWYFENKFKK